MELKPLNESALLLDEFSESKFLLTKSIKLLIDIEKDLILLNHKNSIDKFNLIFNQFFKLLLLKDNLIRFDFNFRHSFNHLNEFKGDLLNLQNDLLNVKNSFNYKLQQRLELKRSLKNFNILINFDENFDKLSNLVSHNSNTNTLNYKLIKLLTNYYQKLLYLKNLLFNDRNVNIKIDNISNDLITLLLNTFKFNLNHYQDINYQVSDTNNDNGNDNDNVNNDNDVKLNLIEILKFFELINKVELLSITFSNDYIKPNLLNLHDKCSNNSSNNNSNDNLKVFLDSVLNFTQIKLKPLMNLFESVHSSIKLKYSLINNKTLNFINGFDFFDYHYWFQIENLLNSYYLQSFSISNPLRFIKNYKVFINFLDEFESYSPSIDSIIRFRLNYNNSFYKKFQFNNYFQLKFKEFVSVVEGAFNSSLIYLNDNSNWRLKQTEILIWSLDNCWNDDIVIDVLYHKFWKFTLQLLSRYKTYLNDNLDYFFTEKSNKDNDDELFEFLINTYVDINNLNVFMTDLWIKNISLKFTKHNFNIDLIHKSLTLSLNDLINDSNSRFETVIISILINKSSQHLRNVKMYYKNSNQSKFSNANQQENKDNITNLIIQPLKDFNALEFFKFNKQKILQASLQEIFNRFKIQINELNQQESNLIKFKRGLGTPIDKEKIFIKVKNDLIFFKNFAKEINMNDFEVEI